MTICFVTIVVTEAIVKRLKAIPPIVTRYRVVVCPSVCISSAGLAVFRGTRSGIRRPFAAEFAACCGKTRNCSFFATFMSNSMFFRASF